MLFMGMDQVQSNINGQKYNEKMDKANHLMLNRSAAIDTETHLRNHFPCGKNCTFQYVMI